MKPRPQPVQPGWDWCDEVWRGRYRGDSKTPNASGQSALATPLTPLSPRTPDERAALASELALEQLLSALPRPAVSSHLATRVLAEIDRESSARRAVRSQPWSGFLAWLREQIGPRSFAAGMGLAVLLVAAVFQFSLHQRRAMAREVAEISAVTAIPGVEVLRNFDAISALGAGVRVHPTDVDLMAAMVAMGN